MTPYNHFVIYRTLMLCIFFLMPCDSFANAGDTLRYPNKIQRLIDTYIMKFPTVTSLPLYVYDTVLWLDLRRHCEDFLNAKQIIENDVHIMSIQQFRIEPDKGPLRKNIKFQVGIWEMKTRTGAESLLDLLSKCGSSTAFVIKSPKRYFIYENYLILVMAGPYNTGDVVEERMNEIIQNYFEAGEIRRHNRVTGE